MKHIYLGCAIVCLAGWCVSIYSFVVAAMAQDTIEVIASLASCYVAAWGVKGFYRRWRKE